MKLKTIEGEESEIEEGSLEGPLDLDCCEKEHLEWINSIYQDRSEFITRHFANIIARIDPEQGDTYHEFAKGGYCIVRHVEGEPRIVFSRTTEAWKFQFIIDKFTDGLPIPPPAEPDFSDPSRKPKVRPGVTRMKTVEGRQDAVFKEWIGLPLDVLECRERRLAILQADYQKKLLMAKQHYEMVRISIEPGDSYQYGAHRIMKNWRQRSACVVRPGEEGMLVVSSRKMPGWVQNKPVA